MQDQRQTTTTFTGSVCRKKFEVPQTPNPSNVSRSMAKGINAKGVLAMKTRTALEVGDVSRVSISKHEDLSSDS